MMKVKGSNVTYYHHTDHLGTTETITNASGTVVWDANYEAHGTLVHENGTVSFKASYTGKQVDEDTGLYYFNARWYDSDLGRFVTEDSARDGTNWYVYCSNNPLRYTDKNGLTMGDYLLALQQCGNENDIASVENHRDEYIAYGGTTTYENGNITPLGKQVSTLSPKVKAALLREGKSNFKRSPENSLQNQMNSYMMTGDSTSIDLGKTIAGLPRQTSASSPGYVSINVSASLGLTVGVGGVYATDGTFMPSVSIGFSRPGLGISVTSSENIATSGLSLQGSITLEGITAQSNWNGNFSGDIGGTYPSGTGINSLGFNISFGIQYTAEGGTR